MICIPVEAWRDEVKAVVVVKEVWKLKDQEIIIAICTSRLSGYLCTIASVDGVSG